MTKPFDYSKWDHIELSDDEEDLHPNIDKDSWFKMKHRNRVEKEEEQDKDRASLEKDLKKKKEELAAYGGYGQGHKKAQTLKSDVKKIEDKLEYMERHKVWHADNMCKTTEDRVIISESKPPPPKELPKDPSAGYVPFIEEHEDLLEEYIKMGQDVDEDMDPSYFERNRDFLVKHGDVLVDSEHAEFYLMLDALEKEMNGFHGEMRRSARQNQLVVHLRELSRAMHRPARDSVWPVFEKLIDKEETRASFQDAVEDFIKRVEKRAVEKKIEMDAAGYGEEAAELGPGGLDPLEVLKTLPPAMQQAFEDQDIAGLHAAVAALSKEDAKYHMQRCEDSGLWVPGPGERPPYRD